MVNYNQIIIMEAACMFSASVIQITPDYLKRKEPWSK